MYVQYIRMYNVMCNDGEYESTRSTTTTTTTINKNNNNERIDEWLA